ncbi:MAG: glycosyltransferase [Acidimicrobiia bacterium]|nr:glycosyltransferase [Acidimicrobiia bacterium]
MSGELVGVSVVIPTFNRAELLADTVRSVFASDVGDVSDLGGVEVIVVDDGSAEPAEDALATLVPPFWCRLRVVRQDNAGVGAARNRGYREAVGPIVLFVDDDMLLLPGTLRTHVDAHGRHPNSVVFGRSPYVDQPRDRFVDWVLTLDNDPHRAAAAAIAPATIVASGHLSVERSGPVRQWSEFYADDMRTPVAEEYELSDRLARHGVPILVGRDIIAFHNRTIDVDTFLRQQHGHGRGCAEAARRHPECLELSELRRIITHHGRRSPKATAWRLLATAPMRSALRRAAHLGRRGLLGPLGPAVFRVAAGAWFAAGLRSP